MNNLKDLLDARLFLLDMDGTLYLGDDVFPGAVDFIHTLADTGRQYIYLTNNSSRAGTDYITRLRRLGFPCESENVFTSGMATALYLNQHYAGKPVYEKLDKAVHFLRRGAAFIAANPDWVCPMPAGEVLPDCGSICALLTAASGVQPTYIGKPNRNMVDVISAQTGVPNAQICCVGDRIYTDIAVAVNAGAQSVLVMSGETDEAILKASDVQPKYVLRDVAELAQILRDGAAV